MSVVIARIIFKCGTLIDGGFYLGKTEAIKIVKSIDLGIEGVEIIDPNKNKFPSPGDDIILNVETKSKSYKSEKILLKLIGSIEERIYSIGGRVEYPP